MKDFVALNRTKFAEKMLPDSIAVFFSGEPVRKIGDEDYPFTPDRNFYYLTGIGEPGLILMLVKKNDGLSSTLFIKRNDPDEAKWVGESISEEECRELSGVNDYRFVDGFDQVFASLVFNGWIEYVYLDLENRSLHNHSHSLNFAKRVMENYPTVKICNSYGTMAKLRTIKTPVEVENIKKAISITAEGIDAMFRNAKVGMYEYQLEAYFDFALKSSGVKDVAFKSIVASGKRGTILHYSENSAKIQNSDLVLCDVGAQWNYYSADITRTFPINGKFTPRQKEIYDIVLEGNKLIINTVRPGIPFKSLNETLRAYYCEKLKKIGLINDDSELSEYYYHGVSHLLGLETHDAGRHNEGLLEEGMVLTVEPGLYIREEGIGIRIEDDVLVTADGCEVLSPDIPKTTEEIEEAMRCD